jgi:antitoxin component YwqK of YwqJK toxin-antitoxin module
MSILQRVILIVFNLISVVLFSQQSVNALDKNGKRDGVWQKNYDGTNQLRYEGKFIQGKEIDTFKYYKLKNKKSVLSAIKIFNSENEFSNVIFYASSGKIVSKGEMNGKNFIGKWIYYHKNSNLIMTAEYYNSEGKLEGERNVYFENGNVAEYANYKNGALYGVSKWFSESQRLLQESEYLNNKLEGYSNYYDFLGNLNAKGNYKQNIRVGIWNYYAKNELIKKINHDTNTVLFKKE